MEGVVVEERVRALVNDSQLRATASTIALNAAWTVTRKRFTAFFPLRTIRVVTRVSANFSQLPTHSPEVG